MTGSELYYYDVELVRGSPEYFESLKKSQAIAEEKEKLINQVSSFAERTDVDSKQLEEPGLRESGGWWSDLDPAIGSKHRSTVFAWESAIRGPSREQPRCSRCDSRSRRSSS
jgi:hypothetical protein